MRNRLWSLLLGMVALIVTANAARADCMDSCMIRKWCGTQYESGEVSGYCETMQSDCQAYCQRHSSAAFGALAYSPKTGQTGWAASYDTQDAADQKAVSGCGADDCGVVIRFNDACAALAANGNGRYATRAGSSQMDAEGLALEACGGDCRIQVWSCSFPKN
ncbi:MAG: DUF4189 domain-containing protein [Alphaproteobacteria bacterium]|jgi:Domain of unknown function (DUF4189)|nr:DUF4189 domain-containing protein [Alphaproteobacteria bacterium]